MLNYVTLRAIDPEYTEKLTIQAIGRSGPATVPEMARLNHSIVVCALLALALQLAACGDDGDTAVGGTGGQSVRISDGGAYGSQPWLDLEDGYGAFLVIEASSQLGRTLADMLDDVIEEAIVGQP